LSSIENELRLIDLRLNEIDEEIKRKPQFEAEAQAAQQAAIDLGMLNLQAVQGGEPEALAWRCGDQLVNTEQIDSKLRLTLGNAHYKLRQVEAASGAQYVAVDDATTTFWSKGERARLTLKGKAYSECVRADTPAVAFRASGNEPGWQLEMGTRTLFTTADGATRIEALTPVAEPTAGARRYAVAPNLQVTITPRLCVDSMSGLPRPDSVSVVLDARKLHGCGGDPASLLQGAEWVVEDIAGTGIVDGSRATLNFGTDGGLAGLRRIALRRGEGEPVELRLLEARPQGKVWAVQVEGVAAFSQAYAGLLRQIDEKRRQTREAA
jgi:uncharacterized membrane protein